MTLKQRMMKWIYPLIMRASKIFGGSKAAKTNTMNRDPQTPFHALSATTNSGKAFSFEQLRGRYVLIVNTASQCGYTPQYTQLQELQDAFAGKLAVLGFPANDFGGQEPGSDEEIAGFCQVNFGVSFPLMHKAPVIGTAQQPVYQWLTDATQNGWNSDAPNWNFCKYLIDPQGRLLGFYPSSVSPLDEVITKYLQ